MTRHPLQGKSLRVLGRMRRHGAVELLVVLPDGSKTSLAHGLSRKAIMERIARGDLRAVHLRTGRRKGPRIEPPTPQQALFQP